MQVGNKIQQELLHGSRKGLPLRLHRFSGAQKAIFLGEGNKFYMAEGGSDSKVTEIMHGRNPWELVAEKKSDLNAVQLSGTKDEAANCKGGMRHGMMTLMTRPWIYLIEIICFKENCRSLKINNRHSRCWSRCMTLA